MPPYLLITQACVCESVCPLCISNTTTFFFFFVCLFQSCSECSEPTLAQSLCTLCNKWLCYQCTDVHQHQRAPTTSQYTELHPQQRPSATHRPDLHQRGSSSLPPTGQGKIFTCFKRLLPPFSRPVWQIISGAAQSVSLSVTRKSVLVSFSPLWCFVCLLIMSQQETTAMNNAWQ